MASSLNLLVIAEPHYVDRAQLDARYAPECRPLGLELLVRALREGSAVARPDVIVLLGDFVQDALQPGADMDLAALADVVRDLKTPYVVVPGNHDGDPMHLLQIFGDHAGVHEAGEFVLYSFTDVYDDAGQCMRPPEDLADFLELVGDRPAVVLQHTPVYTDAEGTAAWFTNTDEVRAAYEEAQVALSLNADRHEGVDPVHVKGTTHRTTPALFRPPFRYDTVSIRNEGGGVRADIVEHQIQMPRGSALFDCHTHSHFGYCAKDVHPERSIERALALGLKGLVCVEHAGQVYLPPNEYWSMKHINDPGAIEAARHSDDNRMAAFRNVMTAARSERVRIGLEVEVNCEGRLNLLEEHRDGWDVLLGAVHWLPKSFPSRTAAQFSSSFMRVVEALVEYDIDLLAHPFRIFGANDQPPPTDLYGPMAELLKEHNVAAEVNCHHRPAEAGFFRVCADEGVRIAISSDAHSLHEVGDLWPCLRVLERAGLSFEDVTFEPGTAS